MTNKTVGNGLDRSVKKILSLILSLAMICTMFTTFGITASAAGAIEISDVTTLKSTIEDATEPIVIDIMADIDASSVTWVNNGKDITINLNGHTIEAAFLSGDVNPSSLTINGNGTIKGINSYNNIFDFRQGSTLIANNVKIIGADATGENEHGKQGINIVNATAKLTNCYVSSGKSIGTAENYSAFNMEGEAKCYVENCTFAKGGGGSLDRYYIVDEGGERGKLYDFSGNEISFTDDKVTPVVIGTGYATPVDGDIIKDTDGTPARAETTVTANATIPEPTYTVTIPETINLGNVNGALEKYRDAETDKAGKKITAEKAFTVSAVGVDNLFDGKKLVVSIGTAGTDTTITGDGNTITCKLTKGGTAYTEGTEFARFTNDVDLVGDEKNEQTGAVSVNRCDITKTADYTGTLTFNIEIKEGN